MFYPVSKLNCMYLSGEKINFGKSQCVRSLKSGKIGPDTHVKGKT